MLLKRNSWSQVLMRTLGLCWVNTYLLCTAETESDGNSSWPYLVVQLAERCLLDLTGAQILVEDLSVLNCFDLGTLQNLRFYTESCEVITRLSDCLYCAC